MKKIIFIICIIFLCGTYSVEAQAGNKNKKSSGQQTSIKTTNKQKSISNSSIQNVPETEKLQDEIPKNLEEPSSNLEETRPKTQDSSLGKTSTVFSLIISIFSMCLTVIVSLLFFLHIRRHSKDRKNNISMARYQGAGLKTYDNYGEDFNTFKNNTERKIRYLEGRINELESKNSKTELVQTPVGRNLTSNFRNSNTIGAKFDTKFFRSKHGKVLQDELPSQSGASYKIFDITGSVAKFEYCGGVVNPNLLEDVCDFDNNPADVPDKKRIITTTAGKARRDSYSNWTVVEPAMIRFE